MKQEAGAAQPRLTLGGTTLDPGLWNVRVLLRPMQRLNGGQYESLDVFGLSW